MVAGKTLLKAAAALALLSGLVWLDVALRARHALLEGERCLSWHARPELQRAHWDAWLSAERSRLEADEKAGRVGAQEAKARAALAVAERDERAAESPLKYAVRWLETAVDLFSTPPSPWAARARERLQEARALWSSELAASGLKPEEYPHR